MSVFRWRGSRGNLRLADGIAELTELDVESRTENDCPGDHDDRYQPDQKGVFHHTRAVLVSREAVPDEDEGKGHVGDSC